MKNKTTIATLAALAGYSIFGFSFLFSKTALNLTTPFVLLAVRFLAAFLLLNILVLVGVIKLDLKGKPIKMLLVLGLVQPVLYFICESYGIAMTTASFSGVMIGLVPVVGLVFDMIFMKERCTVLQAVFTVTSVVGVAMTTTGGFGTVSILGFMLLLGAVVTAVLYAIISRKTAEHFSPFERTYVMFALGTVAFTVMALVETKGNVGALVAPLSNPTFWLCILYLSVVSSVCAFTAINFAVGHISAGRAMIFSNFTCVISAVAGVLILKETFTPLQLVGVVIIIISVFGVSWPGSPKKAE